MTFASLTVISRSSSCYRLQQPSVMTTAMYTPSAKRVQLHSLELCLSIISVKKHGEVSSLSY